MKKISIILAFFTLMGITAYSNRMTTTTIARPCTGIMTHANYSGEVIIKS